MNHRALVITWLLAASLPAGAAPEAPASRPSREALTKALWPRERIVAALAAIDEQKARGLLSEPAWQRRRQMLRRRLAGTYVSRSLAAADPPLEFIQNGGFEQVNRNSARNRSRWLWWNGWSWGGDYENSWEDRPPYVHSGRYSARIRCTGRKGRIGIMTPAIPVVPGAKQYRLTWWARGEGDNLLFVNFESGARGTLRQKVPPAWTRYELTGQIAPGARTFAVYFYHTGTGTIWLDDVSLVPVGASRP